LQTFLKMPSYHFLIYGKKINGVNSVSYVQIYCIFMSEGETRLSKENAALLMKYQNCILFAHFRTLSVHHHLTFFNHHIAHILERIAFPHKQNAVL
jgi:hypothetical protein